MNYVPVLKVRPGEMKALEVTEVQELQPLLELMPAPTPREPRPGEAPPSKPPKTLDEHLLSQLGLISEHWGTDPVMVDFTHILANAPAAGQKLRQWADDVSEEGVRLIPVAPLNGNAARLALVRSIAAKHRNGYAIRITGTPDGWGDLKTDIGAVRELMGVDGSDIDLVVDLGSVFRLSVVQLAQEVSQVLPALAALGWRSVSLVSGGYPDSSPQGNEARISRCDIQLWRQVKRLLPELPLQYGDYGVDHPEFGLKPINVAPISSLLKYTLADSWWFMRQQGTQGTKTENDTKTPGKRGDFRVLCQKLVGSSEFMGEDYSWGDGWLSERAGAENSGGSATRRQAMLSHHFRCVLDELAGSAGAPAQPTNPADDELPF